MELSGYLSSQERASLRGWSSPSYPTLIAKTPATFTPTYRPSCEVPPAVTECAALHLRRECAHVIGLGKPLGVTGCAALYLRSECAHVIG